jgi:hypothetical protein
MSLFITSGTITANFKEIVSKNTCTITIQVPGTYVYGGQTYHLYGWDGEADIYIGGHYAGSISGPGTNSMTAAFSYTGTSVRAGASVEVSASRLTLYYSSSGGGQILCPTMTILTKPFMLPGKVPHPCSMRPGDTEHGRTADV